ncbi:MAG: hypothetical protein LH475_13380 [Cryobacterium sp.]|uniref:hypothetical protein n=1 Tax=Cryobacterium sp. TaxID=1926290 RepID=UPI002296726A|nr:hypothetical protein [Cryobacterium sp.]MCY7405590.1 hypothetical protein [Cryobacterium sp.]
MTTGTDPGSSNPGHNGQQVSLTVLAEGPFTRIHSPADGPDALLTTTLRVPVERIGPGPRSARFDVIVRRPGEKPFSLDLGSPIPPWMVVDEQPPDNLTALLQDSRFLAQQVYAVAASTLALFESTLGRRMGWVNGGRLTISAYDRVSYRESGYYRDDGLIRFGHKRDGRTTKAVPLALFRDLVAHEVTHAIVDGYRPKWADSHAEIDQLALHEAIADLVALLSVFSTQTLVEQLLTQTSGDDLDLDLDALDEDLLRSKLFRLGDGLFHRGTARPSLAWNLAAHWRTLPDPHLRGGAIVQVLLRVVARLWLKRLDAPGGRSSLYQVARAGASVGRQVLSMLIRSLGYMAPVDVTFEDLLRGILAADAAVVPDDDLDYRGAVVAAFAEAGIVLPTPTDLSGVLTFVGLRYPVRLAALASDPEEIVRFLWENPVLLEAAKIDPTRPITVERVRPTLRVGPDGFVVSEIGATFTQEFRLSAAQARSFGLATRAPVLIRGGGQLRFDEGGRLSFAALKPILDPERQRAKLAAQELATRPADTAVPVTPPHPAEPQQPREPPQPGASRITAPAPEVSATRRPTFHP